MTTSPDTSEALRAAWMAAERAATDALTHAEQLHLACNRQVQALEFYGRSENWREGAGTGPGRAPRCVADAGQIARQALDPSGMGLEERR